MRLPQEQEAGLAVCLARVEETVDIRHSCGFLTLVTAEAPAPAKGRGGREASPALPAGLDSSTAQLLEEELDGIDCPMAGGRQDRPGSLHLGPPAEPEQDWQLLDLTFGVPLFDMELNAAVTGRITERGLARPDSLACLAESQAGLAGQLLAFIRAQTDDYVPYVTAMLDETEVPFPTRPVWFDGCTVRPLGPVRNK
jgi:hypothetical protein